MPPQVGRVRLGAGVVFLLGLAGMSSLASAAEPCAEQVTARTFHQAVSKADAAYSQMDLDGFQAARLEARKLVPCLAEPITPAQAAGFHRLEAMGEFLSRNHAAAVASLRALDAAAPGYELSEELAPPGHPLQMYYEIARGTVKVAPAPIPAVEGRWVYIDGAAATERPVDRPYLFQSFEGVGRVTASKHVPAGGLPPGLEAPAAERSRGADRQRTARSLGWVSIGSAAVAGGLYLGARRASNTFWDPATPTGELDALRNRTNALGWTSAGVGLVAVGTGGAALLVGSW